MGTYFNPGNESMKKAVNSRIYMDKTGLLAYTNEILFTEENCIAVSHARRFGKSQAAGMIDAYYSCGSDSKELFAPYEIATKPDFEEPLNKYNVIHLDIASIADFHKEDLIEEIKKRLCRDFETECAIKIDTEQDIHMIISDIYALSGKPFVIIIDEWCICQSNFQSKDHRKFSHFFL